MKKNLKKILASLLSFVMLFTMLAPSYASAIDHVAETSVQTFSDGSRLETYIARDGYRRITEYNELGEVQSIATVQQDGSTNIAILDNGDEVFKSIFNTETQQGQIWRKPSGAPDSEYYLFWQSSESISEENPSYFRVLKSYEFGECFAFDWYEYDDNSHDLAINQKSVTAPANKFLTECESFRENAKNADRNMILIAYDMLGFVPGASLVANLGHIAYTGVTSDDTSDVIADALVSYALAVACTVCQPAQVISLFIDSCSLIQNFKKVEKAYNTVKRG